MDLETAQTNTTAKLPLLKQGEYDMWKLRIEQYFQVQDYALWDVIENGNSFKPAAQTTTNVDGSSTTLILGPITADEKTQKKNDMKARSMLLIALPNEHLLTFNQYKDAKTLFAAIQTRFGGNDATKKTQKTLLKQMYENFSAPSIESLDYIFNRLQKIVSQLAILGENISQEDLNLKFLRSLPSEWNTHVVVKGTASSSSSSSSQNLAFMSSTSSTNEVNTAYGVSTTNTQVSTASTQVSTANLSDDTVYAFLASQPNGSQLVHEDLEQIHKDDLEEMDLKWAVSIAKHVECFNCHKLGHFARECRGPRNQDNRSRNQDSSRRTINVEEISSKAMLAIDGAGFDWSFMADEEVPTDMALMAFSDSEVHNDKTCSKTCLKSFETLKTQLDDLRIEFNKFEFNLATYKRGLASVEEQLVFYKKNEVLFYEQLAVLKRDISYKDSEISVLKSELEKLSRKRKQSTIKFENFDNASKGEERRENLKQINRESGYLIKEFQQPEFEGYGPKTSKSISEDTSNEVRESPDASLVEELLSNDKLTANTIKGKGWYLRIIIQGVNNYNKKAHLSAYRNIVPRAVLMKTGLKPLNTARPVNTAHPKTTVYSARPMSCVSKSAQSTVKRPYQIKIALTNKNFSQKVNTAKGSFYTARPKAVNTARLNSAVVNAVRANQGHPQKEDQGYVDSGCSRHMTGNMSYLSDFKEFDGGYVTFGGGAKGGKITGKGTLKTGKLDFEDVYFVKELQFNLFSVSQMCDKKNSVLFTKSNLFSG
ncbi:ribonuclease H-like domain-containing protein [Tanacetum coccineum]